MDLLKITERVGARIKLILCLPVSQSKALVLKSWRGTFVTNCNINICMSEKI